MRPIPVLLLATLVSACTAEQQSAAPPQRASRPAAAPPRAVVPAPLPASAELRIDPIRFPFSGATVEPNIASDGDGGFLVSWIEKTTSSLIFADFRGGNWFQPRMIAHGKLLVNRADFPSIVVGPRGTLFAHWSEANGEFKSVRVARSVDGGATWSEPLRPHGAKESEFGFVSLAGVDDRGAALAWLDGSQLPHGMEGEGEMALHAATIGADGKLSPDVALDRRVCDCCQTAMAMTANGPIVAYRDRSPEEIRDIAIVRATADGWSAPKTLHADGWKIGGCPVNGPQLDASGLDVVAAWYTAANDRPRVNLAFSADGGATFGAPIGVDDGHPAGHVDIVRLADGSALVTWLELAGDGARIEARRVLRDRTRSNAAIVAEIPSASAVGFPRIAVSKQNVAVVWNGGANEPSVKMASIKFDSK
jgi:hypothetical protein